MIRRPPRSTLFPTRRSSDLVPEVIRVGSDATVVTYGACCRIALDAAQKLSKVGIEIEVVDVQSLLPFDVHGKRSEEHTSELQSLAYLVCRLLLEKKNT